MQEYARNNLPEDGWETVYRTDEYRALRVPTDFKVRTDNGTVFCQDGYVVVDTNGSVSAVSVNVFNALYATDDDEPDSVTEDTAALPYEGYTEDEATDDEKTLTTPVGITTTKGLS